MPPDPLAPLRAFGARVRTFGAQNKSRTNMKYVATPLIWATSRENVSSGILDQVRFKPACSAAEAR